jgi:haloacetate dehalogenase
MALMDGFEVRDIDTSGARIHLRHGGKGPPLLLLHGNPMNHVAWHKMAPKLAKHFHVVAMDLRGYGDSSAPEEGPNSIHFSFREMARDGVEVMEALGYQNFMVAGHDRGARTTHRMAVDHPDRVTKAAIIDVLPNHFVWNNTSKEWATRSWHWLFMVQPPPFAETMMGSVPARWFMEQKLSKPGIGLGFFDAEAFEEYVRCFNEKTISGSCADYRACASCDLDMDTADFEAGNKARQPLLILWGSRSHTEGVHGDVLAVWKQYADNVTGGGINCGHYVNEEAPAETLDWFMKFFPG